MNVWNQFQSISLKSKWMLNPICSNIYIVLLNYIGFVFSKYIVKNDEVKINAFGDFNQLENIIWNICNAYIPTPGPPARTCTFPIRANNKLDKNKWANELFNNASNITRIYRLP